VTSSVPQFWGVLGLPCHPGPQFWGPQLAGVEKMFTPMLYRRITETCKIWQKTEPRRASAINTAMAICEARWCCCRWSRASAVTAVQWRSAGRNICSGECGRGRYYLVRVPSSGDGWGTVSHGDEVHSGNLVWPCCQAAQHVACNASSGRLCVRVIVNLLMHCRKW